MKTIMYFHSGSANHGCEAIVRTLIDICKFDDIDLYSNNHWEDYKWGLDEIKGLTIYKNNIIGRRGGIAISIGGDNYCYPGAIDLLAKENMSFYDYGLQTALIGCSITPEVIPDIVDDLQRYSLITARESITYNALKDNGIDCELIPDSAFVLKTEEVEFDDMGKEWIGINASNFVSDDMSRANYENLIEYIMNNTQYNVMLVPHVTQEINNDMPMLNDLYINNGRMRIVNGNAMELKGYIGKCKMLVTARTHASVSSYSQCIPTLVVGYSIKSKGIAQDLFGTYKGYVLPSEDMKTADDLTNSFKWIYENKDSIKKHLEEIMPDYKKECYRLGDLIESICSKE